MRFRWVLVAAGMTGCGTERAAPPAPPVPIEIVDAAPVAEKPRSGSYRTAPLVRVPQVPAAAATVARVKKAGAAKPRWSYRRYRDGQLRALRAYCATRPKDDPRCDGTRVDERVAFAGMDR